MFKIFQDAIVYPKKLVQYQNKKIGFAILYLLIMTLFVTTGSLIYYISYQNNSTITEETTGCNIADNTLVCDGENYDPKHEFILYDVKIYFLSNEDTANDLSLGSDLSFVFQNDTFSIYQGTKLFITSSMLPAFQTASSLTQFYHSFQSMFLFSVLLSNFFYSFLILVLYVLISMISLTAFKKFYTFKQRFVLMVFANTALAVVFTFYRLIAMPDFMLIILILVSFYPTTFLRRGMAEELIQKQIPHMDPEDQNDDDSKDDFE